LTSEAKAFEKDAHIVITGKILDQYNRCAEYFGRSGVLEMDADEIKHFSKMEDESPLLQRAMNWHFYDAYRDTPDAMPKRWFLIKTHLHDIFKVRLSGLEHAISENAHRRVNENAGRVLHYIEDMAVPAHVGPIYHAAPGSSFLQRLVVRNEPDAFDEMPLIYPDELDFELPLTACDRLDDHELSLTGILFALASDTRDEMRRRIPVTNDELKGKTFEEVYWNIKKADAPGVRFPGFAGYGAAGREGFDPKHERCQNGPTNVCLDFFRDRYQALIRAGVRALLLIQEAVRANAGAS
jgi:hypothetical protein